MGNERKGTRGRGEHSPERIERDDSEEPGGDRGETGDGGSSTVG